MKVWKSRGNGSCLNELNWERSQDKSFEAVKEVKDTVGEVANKVEEALDKVDIELKFKLKIAKQDEGHPHIPHKALGPLHPLSF